LAWRLALRSDVSEDGDQPRLKSHATIKHSKGGVRAFRPLLEDLRIKQMKRCHLRRDLPHNIGDGMHIRIRTQDATCLLQDALLSRFIINATPDMTLAIRNFNRACFWRFSAAEAIALECPSKPVRISLGKEFHKTISKIRMRLPNFRRKPHKFKSTIEPNRVNGLDEIGMSHTAWYVADHHRPCTSAATPLCPAFARASGRVSGLLDGLIYAQSDFLNEEIARSFRHINKK
jgi:hypothetical protein